MSGVGGRGLGKRTIAEFVEDDATLELLRVSGAEDAPFMGDAALLVVLDGLVEREDDRLARA